MDTNFIVFTGTKYVTQEQAIMNPDLDYNGKSITTNNGIYHKFKVKKISPNLLIFDNNGNIITEHYKTTTKQGYELWVKF